MTYFLNGGDEVAHPKLMLIALFASSMRFAVLTFPSFNSHDHN